MSTCEQKKCGWSPSIKDLGQLVQDRIDGLEAEVRSLKRSNAALEERLAGCAQRELMLGETYRKFDELYQLRGDDRLDAYERFLTLNVNPEKLEIVIRKHELNGNTDAVLFGKPLLERVKLKWRPHPLDRRY